MVIIKTLVGTLAGCPNQQASGPCIHNFPPFIVAAVPGRPVRLLHFMAIRAFLARAGAVRKVARAPLILPGLREWRLFGLGIQTPSISPQLKRGILCCFRLGWSYCFLNQSCFFRRAKGAMRGSATWLSHRHIPRYCKLTPHCGHRPPAIAAADRLHRQRQEHLLGQNVRQNSPSPSKNAISVSSSLRRLLPPSSWRTAAGKTGQTSRDTSSFTGSRQRAQLISRRVCSSSR